jgi:nucleoside-diphosphate-sugar epimerase
MMWQVEFDRSITQHAILETVMSILVTGGTGFVGSHLVRRLLGRGYQVTSLDKNRGLADDELRALGATLVTGSVTEAGDVERVMAGQELVFHLASPFGDLLQPDEAYRAIEVDGTRNVLAAAERHGVRRVVHCSTQGVHGIISSPCGDEDSPIAPRDYYCYSKAEGEKVAREFLARGMDVVIVRPTSVYGPGDTRGWLKLFRMASKGWFLMVGSGRTLNHPVYVENLIDLFELAALSPVAKGRTYIAGDDEAVTLAELVRAVGRAVGTEVKIVRFPFYRAAWYGSAAIELVFKAFRVKPPVFRRRLSWFITNRRFSIDRAREELGYRPRVSLSEGLARSAAWYRACGYLAPAPSRALPERRRSAPGAPRPAHLPERRISHGEPSRVEIGV